LNKILIANRGEIAVRIIRTCRDMGLATVAVYSDCDRSALHVRLADEAHAIGPDHASESYLRIDKLIGVAKRSGAGGVHPGYGFLAENPEFPEACAKAGLTFIGPDAKTMRAMGTKTNARDIAVAAGVPIVPGGDTADAVGFPLLVKAVAGGGGKGMRIVRAADELESAVGMARSEALSSFGDDRVYFERLLERPRHIEVQLLGDQHGTILAFVERECSIQRRHQKLVEETPSPAVTPELRERLMAAATAIGRAANYTSAGTVEFLVAANGEFYFLEMNTRLQVEHPITEAVTGIDFVRAQIDIACGAKLTEIADLKVGTTTKARDTAYVVPIFRSANGHAIEVRVYAENPGEGFLPSPGRITHLRAPAGPGIRDDSGAFDGWTVPSAYDPLISKVVAWAPDRPGAIARMVRALTEYDVRGISTTIGFCRDLIASPAFAAAEFDTTYIDRVLEQDGRKGARSDDSEETAAIAAAMWWSMNTAGPSTVARLVPASFGEPRRSLGEGGKADTAETVAPPVEQALASVEKSSVRLDFSRATSLWAQRARVESLR
jgi:acetyl-CoA carboxylase biotin carboxylase subunit